MIAAGLGLAVSGVASAAFTGYTVVATNVTNSGQNLTRYELFANFNGATDTVLNVFNFQAQGGWGAHLDAASGFWHKDNSDYSGGILGQAYGTWAPQLTGSVTANRPFDSFLLIGGAPTSTNSSSADPSWGLAGAGAAGWGVAQIPVANLTNANTLGWFNSSPPNLQGRVGQAGNTATDVRVGQFVVGAGVDGGTWNLKIGYNSGVSGAPVQFAETTFSLPAPGAIALLGLAGLAGRRRR
jgi:hypothetical protein